MDRGDGGMPGMDSPSPQPGMTDYAMAGDNMTMHTTFFWGTRVQVLFARWPGERGVGMYILALFVVFATAALVDGLSAVLPRLSTRRYGLGRVPLALLLTAVHAVRMGLAYLVMLAVMSFNVGVLIAAIAGHALGFLVAGAGLFQRLGPSIGRPGTTNGFFVR